MAEITRIGNYTVIEKFEVRSGSVLFEVRGQDQKEYLCKMILGLQPSNGAQKKFSEVARKLRNLRSPNLNCPIDSGFDEEQGQFYIIYPLLKNHQPLKIRLATGEPLTQEQVVELLFRWKKLVEGLHVAQKQGIFHKDIHPENILILPDGTPVLIDFGIIDLTRTLSKSGHELKLAVAYTAPEVGANKESENEILGDVYSLALCMLESLIGETHFNQQKSNENRLKILKELLWGAMDMDEVESLIQILSKCLSENPRDRFIKYSDLQGRLDELESRLLLSPEQPAAIWLEENTELEKAFLASLEKSELKVLVDSDKYQNGQHEAQVRFRAANSEFFVGRGFIEGNTMKVFDIRAVPDLAEGENRSYEYVLDAGLKLELSYREVRAIVQNESGWANVRGFFEKLYREQRDLNSTVSLSKTQKEILDFYFRLLEGEIDYLRKNAFQASCLEWSLHKNEIRFKLAPRKSPNWDKVHRFIQKSTNPNLEDVELVVDVTENGKAKKIKIGQAFRFDPQKKVLYTRDFFDDPESIPLRNFNIREDVSIQEVQFNRQLAAIKAFQKGEIINPDLCAYLFNPEELPEIPLAGELGKVFTLNQSGSPIELNPRQEWAIRKCIYNGPVTMIQGPPGTGKTTLIVELIRQLIDQDSKVKILVTSQSNFAVDNVLEKLSKVGVPLIRFGKEIRIKNVGVKKHALAKTLRSWADATKTKHQKKFQEISENHSIDPTLNYLIEEFEKLGSWETGSKNHLLGILEKFPRYRGLASSMESRAKFENALFEQARKVTSDPDYWKLRTLSNEWIKSLNNLDEKGELLDKMVEVVNVIGATSNHIASGQYAKFNLDFDYVIMDEAGKATPAESLVPITMGKKVILVGDHLQLQPIVTTNKELLKDLSKYQEELLEDPSQTYLDQDHPSLFEMMFREAPEDYKEALDVQRRMPAGVCEPVSRHFYEISPHELQIKTAPEKRNQRPQITSSKGPLIVLDTGTTHHHIQGKRSFSIYNPYNIDTILQVLDKLDLKLQGNPLSIGIICAYSEQVRNLKRKLKQQIKDGRYHNIAWEHENKDTDSSLTIATVDSFQGLEKDIIILDLVRSKPGKHLGFLEIPNRINVALSRVKELLIIVGDVRSTINAPRMKPEEDLEQSQIQKFLTEVDERGFVVSEVKEVFHG